VDESTAGLDDLLPTMATCESCHDIEDEAECATCHQNPDDPGGYEAITEYSQLFAHQRHIAQGLECATCHENAAVADTDEVVGLPGMVGCVDCHEDQAVENECLTCHTPDEELMPSSHVVGFTRAHGSLAGRDALNAAGELSCMTCHEEAFCQECHEGENVDRLTHPLNWEFTHALEAQSAGTNCVSCHSDQTFCADCHNENGLMPQTHRPGWVNRISGGLHKLEAMNDLNSCISCHEGNAELVCSPCHDSK
jgi:hypothetical protein